jgi:ribosomal protein L4
MFFIVEKDLSKPSSKEINNFLKETKFANQKNLFVTNLVNLTKSVNNISKSVAKNINAVSVKDIVNCDNLIIQESL